MKYSILTQSLLFKDTTEEELQNMLKCLGAVSKKYKKGEVIYHIGEVIESIGVVISGSVNIESDDIWGSRSILDHIEPSQIFGETYAAIKGEPLMVNAVSNEDTEILFINIFRLIKTCGSSCIYHNKIISNLLEISAQKNLNLSRRILYTSSKTIRGRLLSYFSHQAIRNGRYQFQIPFNRQQLADYLGVDRSALSNELSKMKSEGILTFEKNSFCLNKKIYDK